MVRDALRSVEGIDAPTFIIWRDARRCYFNAAARRAFPERLGESGSTFVRATPFVQDIVRSVERRGASKDAARLTFGEMEFVAIPLFAFDGAIEGTIVRAGRLEDIPEMYRESQANASLISQIVHLLPVLVYTVRPSGEYDFVNRPFVEYAGLSLQRGGRVDLEAVVHPEDLPNLPAPWRDADAARDLFAAEIGLRRSDGTFRCHAARLTAIRSKLGAVVKWIGTLVDIEDRLVAESSLAEAHAFLDARVDELERVLDVVPIGIGIANGFESDEVLINRSMMEILGEPEPYVPYGHRAFRYLRGVDLEQIDPADGGVEMEYVRRDGTSRRIAVTVVPTKRIDGNGGVVAAYVDVTARRREDARRETLLAARRALSLAATPHDVFESIAASFASFADGCAVASGTAIAIADPEMNATSGEALQRGAPALTEDGRVMVVPLAAGDRAFGAFALRLRSEREPFSERAFEDLIDFGQTVAISIDRLILLERERSAALSRETTVAAG